jgi:PEGA domain-containing protein
MVRPILIASAIVLSTAALVTAQQRAHGGAPPVPPKQTAAPPRTAPPPPPQPQTVAPPILMPMPSLMLPPAGGLTQPVPFTPPSIQPPRDVFRNGRRDPYGNRSRLPIAYGYGGYPYTSEPDPTTAPAATGPAVVAGGLRLSGTPGEAQVFVDGYFVGTLADIEAGRPLTVAAGPHRLEVRASGYQSIAIDVQITAYETLTYRAALDRLAPPAPRASATVSSSPMYLIPNCYLGNVPPRPNRLPSGCDIKRVQVLKN